MDRERKRKEEDLDRPAESHAGPGDGTALSASEPRHWRRRPGTIVLLALLHFILLAAIAVGVWRQELLQWLNNHRERDLGPRHRRSIVSNGSADERADSDRRLRKLLCGTWQRENNGENVLTLDEDGTGTLVYKPAGKNYVALGFVSRLEIDIEWTVEDGYVDFHSIRGTPQHAFELASLAEGKRKYRRLAELDETHLILVNETQKDDGPKSEWFRVN